MQMSDLLIGYRGGRVSALEIRPEILVGVDRLSSRASELRDVAYQCPQQRGRRLRLSQLGTPSPETR